MATNLANLPTELPNLLDAVQRELGKQTLNGIPLVDLPLDNVTKPLIDDIKKKLSEEFNKITEGLKSATQAEADKLIRGALVAALGKSGLDILKDANGDDKVDEGDTKLLPTDPNFDSNSTQFSLNLGKLISQNLNFDEDIGGLGFKLDGGASANIDITWKLKFGVENAISTTPKFFVDLAAPDDFTAEVSLNLKNEQGQPASFGGSLGFLGIKATDTGSTLNGNFTANLNTGTTNSSRLNFTELGNLGVDPGLTANAALRFKLTTGISADTTIVDGGFPSFNFDLNLLDWNYSSGATSQTTSPASTRQLAALAATTDSSPDKVEFKNVTLDWGSFVKQFASPILDEVSVITTPIKKITDTLDYDFPVLGLSLLDFATLFGTVEPGTKNFIKQSADLVTLTNKIANASGNIPLGDFSLTGTDLSPKQREISVDQTANQVSSRPETADFFNTLNNSSLKDALEFPILDNPTQVVQLLLGQNVDLFTYTTPKLSFGLEKEFGPFPVFGPVAIEFGALASASAQLKFGYDTAGLSLENPNLFNGFYVSRPDDNSPNLSLTGQLDAKAGLSVGIASVFVGGGVALTGGLGVVNPNGQDSDAYKVRGSTISSTPVLCLFEPSLELSAIIFGEFELDFGFFEISKRINIANIKLIDLSAENSCKDDVSEHLLKDNPKPDPKIAGMLAAGGIINRQGTNGDDQIFVRHTGDTSDPNIKDGQVTLATLPFDDSAAPENVYNNVKLVVISGGEGNDLIDMINMRSGGQLDGDNGDDGLIGSFGNDFLTGGSGNDTLDGSAGSNTAIYSSSPTGIYLSLAPDQTGFGFAYDGFSFKDQNGKDQPYKDRLSNIQNIEGSDYADFISGDAANNNLFGAGGSDYLIGGLGNDVLLGGSGGRGDYLDGGIGTDTTTYLDSLEGVQVNLSSKKVIITSPVDGRSTITIDANSGQGGDATGDRLLNIENLHGSPHDDILVGSDSLIGNNSLSNVDGFWGNDIIVAGEGTEILSGGEGTDWLSYQNSKEGINIRLAPVYSELLKQYLPSVAASGGFAQGDIIKPSVQKDADGKESFAGDSSFENLEGSQLNDSLLEGDRQNNIIKGLQGIDSLSGLEGDDTLIGGDGADSLNGGVNSTSLTANSDDFRTGGDTASYESSPTGVEVNLSTNTGRFGDAEGDTFQEIENLIGSAYSDSLTGNAANNDINPSLRDPDQIGQSIFDDVDGGEGRDRLTVDYSMRDYEEYGGVIGGFNTSSLIRSSQSGLIDVVQFKNIERLFIIGTSKRDELYGGENRDNFYTGAGDDFVSAGNGHDDIKTDDGIDTIDAGSGNDSVKAGQGNDQLFGGQGNDQLVGGDGNDFLQGTNSTTSEDLDSLTGGGGADRFIVGDSLNGLYYTYDTSQQDKGYALITDFNPEDGDIIQITECGNYELRQTSRGIELYSIDNFSGGLPVPDPLTPLSDTSTGNSILASDEVVTAQQSAGNALLIAVIQGRTDLITSGPLLAEAFGFDLVTCPSPPVIR